MKYRKKPVEIDAIKFEYTDSGLLKLKEFCGKYLLNYGKNRHPDSIGWAEIGTLEDGVEGSPKSEHIASDGDYIIRGVAGEFYPCKPHIFEQTYEKVE